MAVIISMDTSLETELDNLLKEHKRTALQLRTSTARQRIAKLSTIEKWILKNRTEIQKAIYADFKKPEEEADLTEIYPVLAEIRHAKANLKEWTKPKKVDVPLSRVC